MKKILKDFGGKEWFITSKQEVVVDPCPNCGKPLQVQLTEAFPPITHVVFHNSEGKVLGLFDTKAFPEIQPKCHFCGYIKK